MKTAILISGYLRTFKDNIPKFKKDIIDELNNVDIYVHITKNEHKEDVYLNNCDFWEDIDYINKVLKPISIVCEDNFNFSNDKKINNLYNLWSKYYQLNQIKKINETKNNRKYDLVIKYRFDLNLISTNIFNEDFTKNKIFIPNESVIDKNKLLNQNDKYICDIFAYGNSEVMDKYFSVYEFLDSLIEKYGTVSETILYYYLLENDIEYNLKPIDYNVILSSCNVFAICGDSGSGKTTLGNILKKYFSNSFMLECDRYHKWERHDNNWTKFTHLNPESNYITKMNEDIFDLKIGNTIFQVDYDHKTGKFTDKETIDSSDNLIVCGLHSLYTNDENLYNLKIYIDTEESLKNFWKITRDTKQRGYTLEKSLQQIESRKKDYYKFIYPQREKSDLIINFYCQNLNYENFKNDDISLKIFVKNKYNISELKQEFCNLDLCDFEYDENFNIFNFKKYKNVIFNNGKLPNFNNFYDYIMFVIIHLNKLNL